MIIWSDKFHLGEGDFAVENEIDLALLEKFPKFMSFVRTEKASGIKYILVKESPGVKDFCINTRRTVVALEDVWPEIEIRITFL
jgi:hypothetical protein